MLLTLRPVALKLAALQLDGEPDIVGREDQLPVFVVRAQHSRNKCIGTAFVCGFDVLASVGE